MIGADSEVRFHVHYRLNLLLALRADALCLAVLVYELLGLHLRQPLVSDRRATIRRLLERRLVVFPNGWQA